MGVVILKEPWRSADVLAGKLDSSKTTYPRNMQGLLRKESLWAAYGRSRG